MIDATPCDVGHVQQAVDATEVHEGAIVGDVLDDAVDDLAFAEVGDEFVALLGAAFLENGSARDNDVAAPLVHLEDVEGLDLVHQRAGIAHGADVDLAAGKEGHGAVEVDGEAALDASEDHAGDALLVFVGALEARPGFLAAGLVAREDGFTHRVLDAVEEHFHRVTDLDARCLSGECEFLECDLAFGLQTDVDDRVFLFNADHAAGNDVAFLKAMRFEAFLEEGGEIFLRGIVGFLLRSARTRACHMGVSNYRRMPTGRYRRTWSLASPVSGGAPQDPVSKNKKSASGTPGSQGARTAQVPSAVRTIESARPTAVSISRSLVSSKCASALRARGATGRLMSRSSRVRMSARTSRSVQADPWLASSR